MCYNLGVMDNNERTVWTSFALGCAAFLVCAMIFGGQCQQNADNRQADIMKSCFESGGEWVADGKGLGNCIK